MNTANFIVAWVVVSLFYLFAGACVMTLQIVLAGEFYDYPDHFWSFSWVKKRSTYIGCKIYVLLLWPIDLVIILLSIVFVFAPIMLVKAILYTGTWEHHHQPAQPPAELEVIVTRDDRRSRRQQRRQQWRRKATRR